MIILWKLQDYSFSVTCYQLSINYF